jgi:predicted permease
MNWHDLKLRLRAIFLPNRAENELEEELRLHLEMQARRNREAGMSEAESRRRAAQQFGSIPALKEQCRDERRVSFIATLFQDIRYALRGFRRTPVFALTVMATISLGLGINTAVFTIFNAYVLRPLAVSDPYSLYTINWSSRSFPHAFSWPQYQQLRADNPAIAELFAWKGFPLRVQGHQCFTEMVTGNYFAMLGVRPALGRLLTPSDSATPGREAVVVVAYHTWRNIFGSDPDIVGRRVFLHGYPVEVVGVAPEGFNGLNDAPRDFWVPLTLYPHLIGGPDLFAAPAPEVLEVIVRLKPGVDADHAKTLLRPLAPRLTPDRPESERAHFFILESRATPVRLTPQFLTALAPIFMAFVLVLLMACANVANMMLARALARQREMGIRLSLGAARSRLIRQLLTESVLLALPGAIVGLAVSQLVIGIGTRAMLAVLPAEFTDYVRIIPLEPDLRVFAFMMVAAAVSGIVFGLAPALQTTRIGIVQAARGDFGHQYRPGRLRNFLVVVQVTVCSTLLICAGVLLRQSQAVGGLDLGMRTGDVVSVEVQDASRDRILAALSTESPVREVAASTVLPLDGGFPSASVTSAEGKLALSSYNYVSPEFFDVLGIPLIQGRNFSREESLAAAPVAIVSQTLAHLLWPGQNAVGQPLRMDADPRSHLGFRIPLSAQVAQVIGVFRDINNGFVDSQDNRTLICLPTTPRAAKRVLLLRVSGDAEAARQTIDKDLAAVAPGAVDEIHAMRALAAGRAYPFRIAYWISALLGTLALLLTLSGVYGVLSYLVEQRTREMGVRIALGATAASLARMVLKQSLRLSMMGTACGVALAYAASRMLSAMLPAIGAFDAPSFAGGILLVLCVSLAAAFVPSLRAARVEPVTTLRHE